MSDFQNFPQNFRNFKISIGRKIFFQKLFFNFLYIFIKHVNVAFQQAIGRLLTLILTIWFGLPKMT